MCVISRCRRWAKTHANNAPTARTNAGDAQERHGAVQTDGATALLGGRRGRRRRARRRSAGARGGGVHDADVHRLGSVGVEGLVLHRDQVAGGERSGGQLGRGVDQKGALRSVVRVDDEGRVPGRDHRAMDGQGVGLGLRGGPAGIARAVRKKITARAFFIASSSSGSSSCARRPRTPVQQAGQGVPRSQGVPTLAQLAGMSRAAAGRFPKERWGFLSRKRAPAPGQNPLAPGT